jgi:hypothetical protein
MSLWKTRSDVWDNMVVEEGLTRTWPWWTMHWRRASGSLGIEEPDVMEKGKWMFNPRNQANHEESHITKCQSPLNQYMKWPRDQKWKLIIWCEVLQVTIFKKSMPKQDQLWQPSWSQKEMKWQESTLWKIKLKNCILYLILSVGMPLLTLIKHRFHAPTCRVNV